MPVLFWSNEVNMAIWFKWVWSSDFVISLCLYLNFYFWIRDFWDFLMILCSPLLSRSGDIIYGTGRRGCPGQGATTLLQILQTLRVARWAAGAGEGVGGTCQHPVSVKISRTAIQWVISAGKPHEFEMFLNLWAIKHAFFSIIPDGFWVDLAVFGFNRVASYHQSVVWSWQLAGHSAKELEILRMTTSCKKRGAKDAAIFMPHKP